MPGSPPQTTFDLSAFRKEIERRLEASRNRGMKAGALGHEEDHVHELAVSDTLEGVLAELPGEGETDD
jgi:hypothetical protein